jgi:FtsH-binding integral membrane protein
MSGLWAVLCISGVLLFSLAGLLLVRRLVPAQLLTEHNEVAGFIYTVIGAVYGVLLAFVVLVVWQQHMDAQADAAREASLLADVYRDADVLPDTVAAELRTRIVAYASSVSKDEWPLLAEGQASSQARTRLHAIWTLVRSYSPESVAESAWYAEILERLSNAGDARQQRLHNAASSLPALVWIVLIFGAIVTIGFSLMFGARHYAMHLTMVFALAGIIGMVLVLIASLDKPYSGLAMIHPHSFEQLAPSFQTF